MPNENPQMFDIRKDASREPRGAKQGLVGRLEKRKERLEHFSIGLGALLLAVLAGTALTWFVQTRLLTQPSALLAALPASTTTVLIAEEPGSAAKIMQHLPDTAQNMVKQWTTQYQIDQQLLTDVLATTGAFGQTEGNTAPYAVLKNTDALEQDLTTLVHAGKAREVVLAGTEKTPALALASVDGKKTLLIVREHEWLLVAEDAGVLKLVDQTAASTGTSLAHNDILTNALQKLPHRRDLVLITRNIETLQGANQLPAVLQAAVALPKTGTTVTSIQLETTGARIEGFMPGSETPSSSEPAASLAVFLPEKIFFAVGIADPEKALADAEQQAQGTQGNTGEVLMTLMHQIEAMIGMGLKKDTLANLTGPMLFLGTDAISGRGYALVAHATPQADEAFLQGIEQHVIAQAAQERPAEQEFPLDDGTTARELVPDTAAFTFEEVQEGSTTIRALKGKGIEGGFAHARVGDTLIFGTNLTTVQRTLRAQQGNGRFTLPQHLRGAKGASFGYLRLTDLLAGFSLTDVQMEEEQVHGGTKLHGYLR